MSTSKWRAIPCGLALALATVALPHAPQASAGALAPTTMTASFGYFGATSAEIIRSQSVDVAVTLKAGSTAVGGVEVELLALPYGSTWRTVATAVTDGAGNAHVTRYPIRRTTYKWRFLGNATYATSTSSTITVKVHTKVTLRLEDSTIRAGQRVVARGWVRPAKPGVTASLWRNRPSGDVRLATALIRSDGSYRIAKSLSGGVIALYVTVPAASGNLAGRSPNRTVYVN